MSTSTNKFDKPEGSKIFAHSTADPVQRGPIQRGQNATFNEILLPVLLYILLVFFGGSYITPATILSDNKELADIVDYFRDYAPVLNSLQQSSAFPEIAQFLLVLAIYSAPLLTLIMFILKTTDRNYRLALSKLVYTPSQIKRAMWATLGFMVILLVFYFLIVVQELRGPDSYYTSDYPYGPVGIDKWQIEVLSSKIFFSIHFGWMISVICGLFAIVIWALARLWYTIKSLKKN